MLRLLVAVLLTAGLAAGTLTASAGGTAATDAPARSIIFSLIEKGDSEIFRTDASGSRRLTSNRSDDAQPRVSPDGTRIAFASDRAGSFDIYVMSVDGKGVRRVTTRKGDELFPAWSPDGKRIAFASKDRTRAEEIYVVDATGGDLNRLTHTHKTVIDTHPSFSPDGRHLLYASNRIRAGGFEIFRLDLSNGSRQRLTFEGPGRDGNPGQDMAPEYSPDGKTIVFASDRTGTYQVFRIDAAGDLAGLKQLTRHARTDANFPRFSADGKQLTYMTASTRTGRTHVYTAQADGSEPQRVALGETPDW